MLCPIYKFKYLGVKLTADVWDDTVIVEIAEEEAVHQGGFAQSSFAHNHQSELEAAFHRLSVNLLGKGGKPDVVSVGLKANCIKKY